MSLTIQLTDEQERFLKQFAKNQNEGARDNVGTHKPIHLVQRKRERIIHDDGESGDEVYFCHDSGEIYGDPTDLVRAEAGSQFDEIASYDDAEYEEINGICVYDYKDYFKAYGVNACICSRVYEWQTVSYHFTLAEAKRYMEYQKHNLTDPRTYTVSGGYSNKGDYEPFWDLLMAMGTQLLAGEGD